MTKNLFIIASLATLTTLVACGDDTKGSDTSTTSGTTTATTGTTTGTTGPVATEIDVVLYPACTGTTWVYYAETLGWTDGNNIVNAWETGSENGWNDEHGLPSVDFDPAGAWDALEQSLEGGVAVADWTPDTSTVFECGVHDIDPTMSFAIRVYDIDGNYADCAVFDDDQNNGGITDVYDGMAPSITPVTNAAEITDANCTDWAVSR